MHWEVAMPLDGGTVATVTVEGDSWFAALRAGLVKRGLGGKLISNLTCEIAPDKTVRVTDFVTRNVYVLKPLGERLDGDGAPGAPLATFTVDDLPESLPAHVGFAAKDAIAEGSSDIFLRERLLAVAPGTDRDSAARLAVAVFEKLKLMGAGAGRKLWVSVQVFDHAFAERFARPAITVLDWKEWSPKMAKLQFPLSGAEEIRLSRMPPVPWEEAPTPPSAEEPPRAALENDAPTTAAADPENAAPEPAKRGTGPNAVLDDVFFRVFEKMQEIYARRDHDEAAEFALDLAREFIPCEAGSSMLITPGKYELYVAAARGEVADTLRGRRMSLTSGIVGFAARAGAIVTVSDPESDPRFNGAFDTLTAFKTRNVLCAPLQHEGKTLGAIELINTPRQVGFLQSEANLLSYIAGAVAEYIDTSLPSREAEFDEKEFAEILSAGRPEVVDGERPVSPTPAPAKKPLSKETSPEIPIAKLAAHHPTGNKGKKRKR